MNIKYMRISQAMISYIDNQILIKCNKQGYPSHFASEFGLNLCSKILIEVLHNMSLIVLLPWKHTKIQTWAPLEINICQ